MSLSRFVCVSVCLSVCVCVQNISESYERISKNVHLLKMIRDAQKKSDPLRKLLNFSLAESAREKFSSFRRGSDFFCASQIIF